MHLQLGLYMLQQMGVCLRALMNTLQMLMIPTGTVSVLMRSTGQFMSQKYRPTLVLAPSNDFARNLGL